MPVSAILRSAMRSGFWRQAPMPILVTGAHHFLAPGAASDLPAICLRQIFILAEEGGRGLLGRVTAEIPRQ